jgi:hypothetical protein
MAKFGRDPRAARSLSASLLLSGRYLAIATSLKGQDDSSIDAQEVFSASIAHEGR